jgi:putative transposase
MVTTETWGRRSLLNNERWAKLLIDTLYHYRGSAYLLHEFVIMPDHFHALISPQTSLEKAVQFIKGGFSYRTKKELGSNMEVWQKGFQDHRIRDAGDYAEHVRYIHENPVKERLCERPEEFPYSSAHRGFELDPVPQGLKPNLYGHSDGAAEAAPFQNRVEPVAARLEGAPLPSKTSNQIIDATQTSPLKNTNLNGTPEGAPFRSTAKTA